MGAGSRGSEAMRVAARLPPELDVPLVRVALEAYEAGDGTLDGVWMCIPKETLERLEAFLEADRKTQDAQWKRYTDEAEARGLPLFGLLEDITLDDGTVLEVPMTEQELIEEFLTFIHHQLFVERWDADGNRLAGGVPRTGRVIDGGKLVL